nr:hypothetical protein [Deltaproteobacteria bacterium]
VTLCDLRGSVDLVLVRDGLVVGIDPNRPPCAPPCDECPIYGSSGPDVDAVLWLPAQEWVVNIDDTVDGLDVVALPTADGESGSASD